MPALRSDAGRQIRATHHPSSPSPLRPSPPPGGRKRLKRGWWVGRTSRSSVRTMTTPSYAHLDRESWLGAM
eukprot:839781-Pleurochrysis_carterae.AAC.3